MRVGAGESSTTCRPIVNIVLPRVGSRRAVELIVGGSAANSIAARDTLAVGVALTPVPYHIIAIAVHGHVVVHRVVYHRRNPVTAAEDARVQNVHERTGLRGRRNRAGEELLGSVPGAVELLVGVATLDYCRTFERDAREETLRLGVAENAGHALERCGTGRLGVSANRPSGQRYIASQRQRAGLRKSLDRVVVVEDEDEVGKLEADLPTEASADRRDGARGAPVAVRQARDDEAATETTRAEEAGFQNCDDGEALRVAQYGRRDDLVGPEGLPGVDEGCENLPALLALR